MRDSSGRRVKIVCTLGPSTQTPEKILELAQAGMDVARLNFSHGDHDFHKNLIKEIRHASKQTGRNIAIMQDLQGPKIRLGLLPKEGVDFSEGDRALLHPEGANPSVANGVKPLPVSAEIAEPVARDVRVGARILFDDGKLSARAIKVKPPEILIEFEVGGRLTSRKGMNLPDSPLSIPCLTDKDIQDLKFGVSQGIDAVALSFVRSPGDVERTRELITKFGRLRPSVIAKIEREEAVQDFEAIIDVSDGLLVARGDMAVELGADRVPIVQKQLIRACNELGVPIITATQMLESMIQSATPTRAEANDVANAVFDGTDAVMLSGETASGQYPIRAVTTMDQIIREAEQFSDHYSSRVKVRPIPGSTVDTIEFSAARIADHVDAKVIACVSHSGNAVRTLAKFRPEKGILAIVDQEEVLRKLALVWGVKGILIPGIVATDDLFSLLENLVRENGIAEDGDSIVVTAGIPSLRGRTTNMVKVHQVGKSIERAGKKFDHEDA